MSPVHRPLAFLVLSVALLACDGSETEPVGPPQQIESLGGANQVGTVGQPLPDPIRVRVVDSSDRGVADVEIVFEVAAGAIAAAPAAQIAASGSFAQATDTLVTDGLGEAAVTWTLGPAAGLQTLTIVVAGVDPLEVTADAEPGPPAQLVVTGGEGQIDEPGATLDAPFAVGVQDEFGNAIGGQDVSWMVGAGGGSLSTMTSQTGADGTATTTLTLGPGIGFNTVTATHGSLTPVDLNALGLTFVESDPLGDTLTMGAPGALPAPDLTAYGAAWTVDTLLIGLAFRDSVTSLAVGGPAAVAGLVQFDIDLDPGTGLEAEADKHRESGSATDMGVDVSVDLFRDENGEFLIFDANPEVIDGAPYDIRGPLIAFRVPASLVGTDSLTMSAALGTPNGPTDIIPNDSSFVIEPAGGGPLAPTVVPRREVPRRDRTWGPRRPPR